MLNVSNRCRMSANSFRHTVLVFATVSLDSRWMPSGLRWLKNRSRKRRRPNTIQNLKQNWPKPVRHSLPMRQRPRSNRTVFALQSSSVQHFSSRLSAWPVNAGFWLSGRVALHNASKRCGGGQRCSPKRQNALRSRWNPAMIHAFRRSGRRRRRRSLQLKNIFPKHVKRGTSCWQNLNACVVSLKTGRSVASSPRVLWNGSNSAIRSCRASLKRPVTSYRQVKLQL